MDFMYFLPPEILEKILSYIDNDDLKNCIQVSDLWRRNINDLCSWKHLCIKNDWFLENSIDQVSRSTWKQCFWLNFNWYYGFYDTFKLQVCPLSKIHLASDLVIRVYQNRIEIWSFNVIPRLEQTLTFSHMYRSTVKVFKDFLINQQNTSLQIYHRHVPTKLYRLFREINMPDGHLGGVNYRKLNNKATSKEDIVLIKLNEYFVAVTFKGNQNIFAWNLETDREWIIAPNIDHIFQMEIELNVLFIVILDMTMSCYKVRGFNLDEQVWTLEVILYDNTPFGINPPVIWVNAWFVMSIAEIYQFQNRYLYSPLKVWNREGRFVALEFPNCSRQPYFQCCLKENIVIFTINDNTVAVWEPLGETITRSFTVERGYDDIQMVPGNAVAISYSNMLQFWDWKIGVQLQCINFEMRAIVRPVVNDQYYVHENMEDIVFFKFQNSCKNILL